MNDRIMKTKRREVMWLTTKYWQRTVHMDSEEPVNIRNGGKVNMIGKG